MMIFLLIEVVQDEIANRIKNARGFIMADGLSRGGTHYEATMYAYVKDEGKADVRFDILLLGCTPMVASEAEEEQIAQIDNAVAYDDDESNGQWATLRLQV